MEERRSRFRVLETSGDCYNVNSLKNVLVETVMDATNSGGISRGTVKTRMEDILRQLNSNAGKTLQVESMPRLIAVLPKYFRYIL